MFQIGEFSKIGKTTVKTLRYYDEIWLLKPEYIDPSTNYRFYTADQLFKLHEIKSLRQTGLSIGDIKSVFQGSNAQSILEKHREDLISEIQTKREQLSSVNFILSEMEGLNIMKYHVNIKELPEYIVYSKKMTVPGYDSYFEIIPEIGKSLTEKYPDLKTTSPEYCFISYLDGEYVDRNMNIEFCEAIDSMREDFDDIKFKTIEATTVASVLHRGPYSDLSKAYAYLFKWIEYSDYSTCGDPRESYIDGIWNKEDQSEWLTEVQIPITRK